MLGHGVFFIAGDPEINPQLTFRRRLMLSFFHDNMPWYQAIKCAAAVGVGVEFCLRIKACFLPNGTRHAKYLFRTDYLS